MTLSVRKNHETHVTKHKASIMVYTVYPDIPGDFENFMY